MGWLTILLGLADPVQKITTAIIKARADALNATTEQDRIASQEAVATLQARRDVLIADTAHGSLDIWIRSIIAIGPALYLFKIFVIDKVFGFVSHTRTDPLDENLWTVVMVVLGFYFLSDTSTRVARLLASRK